MNPQRMATMATAFQTVALPACVVAWIAAFGSPVTQGSGVTPFINHLAPSLASSLAANAEFTAKLQSVPLDKPQAIASDLPPVAAADKPQAIATDEPRAITINKADEAIGNANAAISTADVAISKGDVAISKADVAISSADVAISSADVAISSADVAISSAEVATAGEAVKSMTLASAAPADAMAAPQETGTPPAADDQKPIVTAALTAPAEVLPSEAPAVQPAATGAAKPEAADIADAVGNVAVLDECYVVDTCIDRYLWALYERTKKEDTITQQDRRQVTVKRKGKLVTVTRTVTTMVDEDFGWKDPRAAEKARMSMTDYVIGGMDQGFKQKLFRMLLAAEQAGLSPGITSAFRDDYRQSIASGLKAASDRSYHGGSFRGGYGHGLAADVVSTRGDTRAQRQVSSEILWKWIDVHGHDYGVARPYLDHDPPHVGPTDGLEYASHYRGKRARTAGTDTKKRAHEARGGTKHQNTARSSRHKTT